jgi:hypothetical protein
MKFDHIWLVIAAAVAAISTPATAAVELVQNGGFETTTLSGSYGFGDRYSANQVAGWTTSGYNFVFTPGSADTSGAEGERGHIWLWGPDYIYGNGRSDNGLTATSPAGGNFVGSNGDYEVGAISQQIAGLSAGSDYTLSFYWAAAQQMGYNGTTLQNWTVSLGDQSFVTDTVTTASHGFTPWQKQTFTFTATGASELLSFLASGTPNGSPPFALLDGVSLQLAGGGDTAVGGSVPEPATWAVFILGFGVIGATMRVRRRAKALVG